MNRRLLLPLLLLLAWLAWLAPRARAEDEPAREPPVKEELLLASVVGDPLGDASQIAARAREALLLRNWGAAFEQFTALAEEHGDVLVSTAALGEMRGDRASGALHWPAWRVANHGLAKLPEALRTRLDERWAPLTNSLRGFADRGRVVALELMAERYAATRAGSGALLLLATRDLESGRLNPAAERLQEWLDLNPQVPTETRAAVAVRLADALSGLDDAGALDRLQVLEASLRSVPVRAGGETTTLGDRIANWRSAQARHRAAFLMDAGPSPAAPLSGDPLALLWSRSIRDPDHLTQSASVPDPTLHAGVWGRDDTLVLHEGRVVRRLDLMTGRERWQFPASGSASGPASEMRPATIHDPRERYQGFDIPWRSVTPAGNTVLVVLGDPGAVGRYTFLEQEYEADRLGRECRLRLACLDLETGRLLWFTGGPEERHPVLGHRATGCASPPLVVGDDVYCLFARRHGATSFFLACLDRHTGRPRWVAPLAAGESGRLDDQSRGRDRFTSLFVQSVPWGARPTRAGDEICVVPHAGFAAGVDVERGVVRWLRALPRYALDDDVVPPAMGHNLRNVPVPWGDAWIVAPMDSPHLLCLARGSGALRWQRGEASPRTPPAWRDLLGVQRDTDGTPRLHLSGWMPLLMTPQDGGLEAPAHLYDWRLDATTDPGGMALNQGAHVVRAGEGLLQAQVWLSEDESAEPILVPLPVEAGAPYAGDVQRVGDVWVVIGTDRVAALAPMAVALEADLQSGGAAERGLLACLLRDPAGFDAALDVAAGLPAGSERERTYEVLRDQMSRVVAALEDDPEEGAGLERLARALDGLPVSLRGALRRDIATRLLALAEDAAAAQVLLAWLAEADDTLVETLAQSAAEERQMPRASAFGEETAIRVRGDLIAVDMLRRHADRPEVRKALERHEHDSRERIGGLLAGPEEELRDAIRRAAGTRAADDARRSLGERLTAAKRYAAAAAITADRRLDPPWRESERMEPWRIQKAARLQMREAGRLAEAAEGDRARTLAADLERWAPRKLQDDRGRTSKALQVALRRRFGWYPQRRGAEAGRPIDAWRGRAAPVDRDNLRSVEFLGLQGPGAEALAEDHLLLVRGITLEVWSRTEARRTASLSAGDEGWFGGSLTSVERWIPGGGITVSSVVAHEPADGGGVNDGDWVRTWDGHEVTDLPAFMQLVAASRPGVEIPISVWRHGREVLDRFKTGRRPQGQGRLLRYGPLWVDDRGRVLVPSRTALAHVHPKAGTRTRIWTWSEGGVVRRLDVFGGEAYVRVQRSLQPHVLVAVDADTGRERWRCAIRGRISRVEPVGSAICIHTIAPSQALFLDRHDGRPRALCRSFDRHRREFRKNWVADASAAMAAGRGFVVQGTDDRHHFLVLNTTTGALEHDEAWDQVARARYGRYVNPHVAAGAFVSVTRTPSVRLYFPDPLGGPPRHTLHLSSNDLSNNQGGMGPVDDESRTFVKGGTLFTLRLPMQGRKQVTVAQFRVDYEALAGRDPTSERGHGDVFQMLDYRTFLSGATNPPRYVLNAEAYFEGISVSAARLVGEHQAEYFWVAGAGEDAPRDNKHFSLFEGEMREARRHPPVRSGRWLIVPTDEGAVIYPIQKMR